jgi:hypothetical protein
VQLKGSVELSVLQEVTVVQIDLLKILLQRLSNHFTDEQETPADPIAISRRKKNKPMLIDFSFCALIDLPFVTSIGISQFRFSAGQFAGLRSIWDA